jgi:hypothetical protein
MLQFLFVAFQILCIKEFHHIFQVLPRNVTTFVTILPRIQILLLLWGIYRGLKYYRKCYGFIEHSNFTCLF